MPAHVCDGNCQCSGCLISSLIVLLVLRALQGCGHYAVNMLFCVSSRHAVVRAMHSVPAPCKAAFHVKCAKRSARVQRQANTNRPYAVQMSVYCYSQTASLALCCTSWPAIPPSRPWSRASLYSVMLLVAAILCHPFLTTSSLPIHLENLLGTRGARICKI